MGAPSGKSARTKARILAAARHLFAQRDIASVSIRDIAEAAGVSHGLVQRYFGTREQMIAEIIRQEVAAFAEIPQPLPRAPLDDPDQRAEFRAWLRSGFDHFREYAALIVRAELAGIRPEAMLDPATPTPATIIAERIASLQGGDQSAAALDARIVSAYINAALFAFGTMAPWLIASVGLDPDDYERHLDQISDISYQLIVMSAQAEPGA